MPNLIARLTKGAVALQTDRRAVTAMEYGLIAALIAVVIIGAVTTVGTRLSNTFTHVSASLPAS